MADPKVKNGYTRIAHELLEALCLVGLNGAEFRVVLAVVRATYGWQKREAELSLTDLRNMTGLGRRTLIYSVQNLQTKNVMQVTKQEHGQRNLYALNKDYETWMLDAEHFSVMLNRANANAHYSQSDKPAPKPKSKRKDGMVTLGQLMDNLQKEGDTND